MTELGVGELTVRCRLWTAAPPASLTAARDRAVPAILDGLRAAGVPLATAEALIRYDDERTART